MSLSNYQGLLANWVYPDEVTKVHSVGGDAVDVVAAAAGGDDEQRQPRRQQLLRLRRPATRM